MPKAIKKKPAKPKTTEEGLTGAVSRAVGFAGLRWKRYAALSAAVVLIVASIAGWSFYKKGIERKAAEFEYEGYRLYFGLYEKQPAVKAERLRKALENFSRANGLRESPFSLFYTANIHYALGNYAGAVKTLEDLTGKFPGDEKYLPLSYYKMAMASLKEGRPEEALKYLDALSKLKTDSLRDMALVESARILEGLGRTDEALRKYQDIVKDFPRSPFFEEAKVKTSGKKT